MNERVERYLEKKRAEEKADGNNFKTRMLVDMGLYDEVFYSKTKPLETSGSLWSYHEEDDSWYIKVPIEVTDEEYQQLLKYYKKDDDESEIGEKITRWGKAMCGIGVALCAVGIAISAVNYPVGIIPCAFGIIYVVFFTNLIKGFGKLISAVLKISKK